MCLGKPCSSCQPAFCAASSEDNVQPQLLLAATSFQVLQACQCSLLILAKTGLDAARNDYGISNFVFLLGQAGEDNHEVAMDFMLRGLEHHRFADINPLHVDQAYAGYT